MLASAYRRLRRFLLASTMVWHAQKSVYSAKSVKVNKYFAHVGVSSSVRQERKTDDSCQGNSSTDCNSQTEESVGRRYWLMFSFWLQNTDYFGLSVELQNKFSATFSLDGWAALKCSETWYFPCKNSSFCYWCRIFPSFNSSAACLADVVRKSLQFTTKSHSLLPKQFCSVQGKHQPSTVNQGLSYSRYIYFTLT